MTVGTASFFRMYGSLSSGEYPLINTISDSDAVHIVNDVVYARGLQTTIRVPWFDDVDKVNVAKIGSNFYWITEWHEITTANRQAEMVLDFMAPTSLIRLNSTIDAYLERSPTYLKTYLSDSYTKGLTELADIKQLGNVIDNPYGDDDAVYWVQVSGLHDDGAGHTRYVRYGCFVSNGRLTDAITDVDPYNSILFDPRGVSDVNYRYPSLLELMNALPYVIPTLGTGSSVTDISISRRCPYEYKVYNIGNGRQYITLVDSNGDSIAPVGDTQVPRLYFIDYLINMDLAVAAPRTASWTTGGSTGERRNLCGTISVRDWNKNKIASFPVAESNQLIVQTYADISGIYTIIDNGYQRITIPEGKLPWNGSAWEEYVAYQMDTDRMIMQNAQQYARYDYETRDVSGGVSGFGNAISSMIFGAIAGKGAGAVAGGVSGALNMWASAYENRRAKELALMQADDNFRLAQEQAQNARGTAYMPGYGLIYVALTTNPNDLVAGLDQPIEGNVQLYEDYVDRVGYPCEGRVQLNATYGYYRGYLPKSTNYRSDPTGMYFDELNMAFRQGFKFVRPFD